MNGAVITFTHDGKTQESVSFTYTVSDGRGGADTATVAVTVTEPPPPNTAPRFVQDSYRFELEENRRGPVDVGAVRADDLEGDTVSYTLSGSDRFTISQSSGVITYVGSGEDHEGAGSYALTVTAGDGELTSEAEVTVLIADEPSEAVQSRFERVSEAILPEVSRAMVSGVLDAVTRRIETARPAAAAQKGRQRLAGHTNLLQALRADGPALSKETMDWKRALAVRPLRLTWVPPAAAHLPRG